MSEGKVVVYEQCTYVFILNVISYSEECLTPTLRHFRRRWNKAVAFHGTMAGYVLQSSRSGLKLQRFSHLVQSHGLMLDY